MTAPGGVVTVTQSTSAAVWKVTPGGSVVAYNQGAVPPGAALLDASGHISAGVVPDLSGTYAPHAALAAGALRAWGHSYVQGVVAGGGVTAQSFIYLLAEKLGLPLRNDSVGGSTLTDYTSAGGSGWTEMLQRVTRPGPRYSAPAEVHLLMHGINDLNLLGNTTADLLPFQMALTAVLSRLRAEAIYEETDSSCVFGGAGTWTSLARNGVSSGTGIEYNSTSGGTVTITTPNEFPGGTVACGFITWNGAGDGAVISATLNGVAAGSIDTRNTWNSTMQTPSVLRIPNVPAGTNTIVLTSASVSGVGFIFDYWQYEAPSTAAPLVILPLQPKPLDYTAYGSVAPGPPTDAGVDALNGVLGAVAAQFDSRVLIVDTTSINKDATCFVSGNVHPNAKGHRIIAEGIAAAVTAAGFRARLQPGAAATYAPRLEYGTAAPTSASGPMFYVGDRVVNTAPAEAGTAGSKYVVTGWVCVAQGQPGTWVAERALTGN